MEQFFLSVKEENEDIISSEKISPWVKSLSGIIPAMTDAEVKEKIKKRLRNKYK